ncbi:MAG TPA: SRPBCC family protein [Pseudomonadales bacterium]|nr:SRPBCC family protein [Pseudomonadales bacterium]
MDYLNHAGMKIVVEVETALPRQRVWEAFADAGTWNHWFPKVECASYSGVTPYGVGTTRRSLVDGVFYDETMLVWEEPCRWGYRINRTTSAMARAQLEITELDITSTGTLVRWIFACDPLHALNTDGFRQFLATLLKEAIARLERFYVLDANT